MLPVLGQQAILLPDPLIQHSHGIPHLCQFLGLPPRGLCRVRQLLLGRLALVVHLALPFAQRHPRAVQFQRHAPLIGAKAIRHGFALLVPSDALAGPLRLTFNEDLEPAFSNVSVADASGTVVSKEKAKVDASNPRVLTVAVPKLSSGSYAVHWTVMTHDGHKVKGDYKFTVK